MTNQISFKKLCAADLPLMRQWLNSDFVSRWYGPGNYSRQEVERKYLPRINGQTPTSSFLIVCAGEPVGYIQTYKIKDYADYAGCVQADKVTAGVDMFIGAREYAHRGLGSAALGKFLREIVFREAEVESCIVGPEPDNKAAIRCYEKAGFQYWKTVQIPGEPQPEYLMRVGRGEHGWAEWADESECGAPGATRNMFQTLNEVYADAPELDADAVRERMRQQHRQLVEGQW